MPNSAGIEPRLPAPPGVPAGQALAFKAYEIEELADLYFFRPAGMAVARAARVLGLSPTVVTLLAAAVGVTGGLVLRIDRFAVVAFALLIVHSVFDSADGQLARMTGRVTELGRTLDGVSGYLTHVAIYVAVIAVSLEHGGGASGVVIALTAAAANVVHAQMYDYHRNAYTAYAINAVVPDRGARQVSLLSMYEALQRRLAGLHAQVEAAIARRAMGGHVRDEDRDRYRRLFYAPVRGWNLLGDNTRIYALGLLAWMHRIDWFPLVVLIVMNAAFIIVWAWQARRDRLFFAGL